MRSLLAALLAFGSSAGIAAAQANESPGFISKSIKAIGYTVDGGQTKVDLVGTDLMRGGKGEAKIDARKGATTVEAEIKSLDRPERLGAEFLTYVLWSVSPEGRSANLGEIQINDKGQGKLKATTQFQVFSLIVTAEPYFSVRQPSEMVVLENQLRKDTKGKIFIVNDYKLMRRAQYEKLGNPLALTLDLKKVPLEMYQARNAVDIARSRAADKYAPESFVKAESSLKMAENALAGKASRNEIISTARQTVQFSEDARALAVQRQTAEQVERDRKAAADRARADAEMKANAEADEARRKADAEAQRQAELASAREAQMKAEADAAAVRAQAQADALRAKEEAANAEAERARKAAETLRAQLLEQFNRILETRDTPRGLVVNMSDVLFDTGKFNLRPAAREALAKLSGIVLAHPGLNLAVEGHTDSTGSEETNLRLSEQRGEAVRTYLVQEGVPAGSVSATGMGESMPVADNDTAAGRQKNRRVEIIVSGEVIGTKIGR